ncbi:MAG: bile acid:sodium symporter family protein [Cellvibrionaceae bacterium]
MANFYITHEYWFAVFQLVLAMLGMGATLKLRDFREIILEPLSVFTGSVIQLVVIPCLAFVFILLVGKLINVAAGVVVGIALIAAIPGGTSSNIFTHFAGGNVALSISITAITTLACLVTTPLILGVLIAAYMPSGFTMPTAQIMREITLNLLLPLIVGMAILRLFPRIAHHLSIWCIRGSVLGLIMIFVGASIAGRLDVEQFGWGNIALVSMFIVLIVLVGWLSPAAVKLVKKDCIAIEMEVVVRSVNLGIMLKVAIFPAVDSAAEQLGNMVLFSLLLYGAVQLLLGIALIPLRRKSLEKLA